MKNINRTSSSKFNLIFWFSVLTLLSSRTSFSIKSDIANSFLITYESLVGTKTALSTYFSTILSVGTPIILWTAANLSKSFKNLSSNSIITLNYGFDVLSFLNSTNKISIWDLVVPYNYLYLASWTCTSAVTAQPKLSVSQTSWTYFNTSTTCGIITILSTIFSRIWGTSIIFYTVV